MGGAKREEGAERIAGVFCSTPVCLKDKRVRGQKRRESETVAEEGVRTVQTKDSLFELSAESSDPHM